WPIEWDNLLIESDDRGLVEIEIASLSM
ncbi:MAG: hypothetical protein JWM80_5321, partial [Cyanobacteria bacterium RYN_339]|nr:hypothetical protein [Cyanobacteria bacterium RYN_339]